MPDAWYLVEGGNGYDHDDDQLFPDDPAAEEVVPQCLPKSGYKLPKFKGDLFENIVEVPQTYRHRQSLDSSNFLIIIPGNGDRHNHHHHPSIHPSAAGSDIPQLTMKRTLFGSPKEVCNLFMPDQPNRNSYGGLRSVSSGGTCHGHYLLLITDNKRKKRFSEILLRLSVFGNNGFSTTHERW